MESIEKCECCIGIKYDYENTELVTLAELKGYIEREKRLSEYHKNSDWWQSMCNKYTLDDYCDKRKSTDLTRFNYCPFCGKRIDWKAIKANRSDENATENA